MLEQQQRAGDINLTVPKSKKFTHDDGSFHYKETQDLI